MVNSRADLRICTGLSAVAAVVWVLLLLERSSWGRSPVSDYGTALGLVVLFFLIPAGCSDFGFDLTSDDDPVRYDAATLYVEVWSGKGEIDRTLPGVRVVFGNAWDQRRTTLFSLPGHAHEEVLRGHPSGRYHGPGETLFESRGEACLI